MIDISKIAKKYRGKWVAFERDQKTVVVAADSAKEAYEKAKKKYSRPILSFIPKDLVSFVGGVSHEIRV